MTVNIVNAPRRAAVHVIEEVRFQQAAEQGRPMSEAPVLCRCGAVVTSGTWDRHRGLSDPIEAARLGGRNSRKGAA